VTGAAEEECRGSCRSIAAIAVHRGSETGNLLLRRKRQRSCLVLVGIDIWLWTEVAALLPLTASATDCSALQWLITTS
jgi:hypothetical protein